MGTSQPSAMSLKSHFTVNISFPTKKRPNIATFCTSFFMLLLGKKNEFRTEKRLFLVFLYGIRVFRLQNYTLAVQSFCAVVFLSIFQCFQFSILFSLNSSIHLFASIASHLFHLALSPPNVHPYQVPHVG